MGSGQPKYLRAREGKGCLPRPPTFPPGIRPQFRAALELQEELKEEVGEGEAKTNRPEQSRPTGGQGALGVPSKGQRCGRASELRRMLEGRPVEPRPGGHGTARLDCQDGPGRSPRGQGVKARGPDPLSPRPLEFWNNAGKRETSFQNLEVLYLCTTFPGISRFTGQLSSVGFLI